MDNELMTNRLKALESRSIYVMRETKARFKNPAMLCSFGKDSTTMIHLAKRAFFDELPFPVVHLDTGYKFPEMYEFRDKLQKELGFDLIVVKNDEALADGMNPEIGHMECCTALKTENLKKAVEKYKWDAIFVGIRWDEHGIRGKEHYFSPRNNDFKWNVSRPALEGESKDSGLVSLSDSEFSGWDLYTSTGDDNTSHVRIHPLLDWSETDVWEYTRAMNLPYNPMYLSKDGKRYRSLGCMPCTAQVDSTASNISEIIEELKSTQVAERSGRAQDKEKNGMERLRYLGYM